MAGASLYMKTTTMTTRRVIAAASGGGKESEYGVVQLPEKSRNSRVLVLGGTGRVGGSTAIALSKFCPDLRIVIAGRNR